MVDLIRKETLLKVFVAWELSKFEVSRIRVKNLHL
jgi:hypothetical protein